MWFSSMFALIVTNDSHWKENALRNITLCNAGSFFDLAKKLKDEKTQNSSEKLKDLANFGVIYSRNQLNDQKQGGNY